MGTRPGTIELGVYSRDHGPENPLPPGRPEPSSTSWRWWPVVLVALLVWPLAGAAGPPAPPLTLLWTEPAGARAAMGLTVGHGDLYVVTAGPAGPELTAFRLADGSVRWEVPLVTPGGPEWPSSPGGIGMRLIDETLMVYAYEAPETVAAYDPDTAQVRWTGQGYPRFSGAGQVVLSVARRDEPGASIEIRQLNTGAVVASFDDPAGQFTYEVSPDGVARLVGLASDGVLTSYDPFSGAVLRQVTTRHEERLLASSQNVVSIVDDLVLVTDYYSGPALAAYDAATLAPLWTVEGGISANPCAPLVCVQVAASDTRQPAGLYAVDPVSGTVRWSVSCAERGVEHCYLAVRGLGQDGRALVEAWPMGDGPDWGDEFWIIETATGRRLVESGPWRFMATFDAGLLVSRGAEREFWLALTDPGLERIEMLGMIQADWCTPHGAYLVCTTEGEPFQVWRLTHPAF